VALFICCHALSAKTVPTFAMQKPCQKVGIKIAYARIVPTFKNTNIGQTLPYLLFYLKNIFCQVLTK